MTSIKPTLPIDVISVVAGHLRRDRDRYNGQVARESRRALASLARVSRDIYTVVIPHLYHEVGQTIEQLNNLFEPLRNHRAARACPDYRTLLNQIHMIDWPILDRLLWRLSFIQIIRFQPRSNDDEDQLQAFIRTGEAIQAIQHAGELEQNDSLETYILFKSVRHVVIDMSDIQPFESSPQTLLGNLIGCLQGTIPRSPSLCLRKMMTWASWECQKRMLDRIPWAFVIIHKPSLAMLPPPDAELVIMDFADNDALDIPSREGDVDGRIMTLECLGHLLLGHPMDTLEIVKPIGTDGSTLERYVNTLDNLVRELSNDSDVAREVEWRFIETDQSWCKCGSK